MRSDEERKTDDPNLAEHQLNEAGTAEMLAEDWKDSLRWSEELNRWLVRRDGESVWRPDVLVERTAKAVVTCSRRKITWGYERFLKPTFIRNALEFAKPWLAIDLSEFDTNPWALNTPVGVINLLTGELIPSDRVVGLYRLQTRVASDSKCKTPKWLNHLQIMCHGQQEYIDYLQLLAGITLIGDQNLKPHLCPQLNGLGRNGKGVFLQVLAWALGDYAKNGSTRLLTTTENAHTTEQASLCGKRMVIIEEVKRINSSILKDLTGGGMISARKMRADDQEILKTWTIWFNNNGAMQFSGDQSDGLWDRIPTISLGEGIPEEFRVADWTEQVKEEAPGVLWWALEGLKRYLELKENGLGIVTPSFVKKAVLERRKDADPIKTYLLEFYEFDKDSKVKATVFKQGLRDWAEGTGEGKVGGQRMIYDHLRNALGLTIEESTGGVFWIFGLRKKEISLAELGSEWEGRSWN